MWFNGTILKFNFKQLFAHFNESLLHHAFIPVYVYSLYHISVSILKYSFQQSHHLMRYESYHFCEHSVELFIVNHVDDAKTGM